MATQLQSTNVSISISESVKEKMFSFGLKWVRRVGVYRFLLGKPEGRRPIGRTRLRCVDNIRMDLQEVGCGYIDWIGLAQD